MNRTQAFLQATVLSVRKYSRFGASLKLVYTLLMLMQVRAGHASGRIYDQRQYFNTHAFSMRDQWDQNGRLLTMSHATAIRRMQPALIVQQDTLSTVWQACVSHQHINESWACHLQLTYSRDLVNVPPLRIHMASLLWNSERSIVSWLTVGLDG